jgi:glycine/D-amino acid oxidase-like deaminating enzyme
MMIGRRRILQGVVGASLGGCASRQREALAPVRASEDRIFDVTVCLRPFRAQGPRIEAERVGSKLIVYQYGHGGSGWSLSWGSATVAVQMAMADGAREIAVIGCGAIGLTTAITAQQAGAKVTIYAKDLLPQSRSARATGSWTPDSRIALTQAAAPGFPALWEQMARTSFKTYRSYLGLPGTPVEWRDQYMVLNEKFGSDAAEPKPKGSLDFAVYHNRIDDLRPDLDLLPSDTAPFHAPFVYRTAAMQFNISSYGHTLLADFRAAGGTIVRRVFNKPQDFAALRETTIIACPGYGARDLFQDISLTPVRGQIAWLLPQPELHYGLFYDDVFVLPRSDGIVVQDLAGGDMKGYGDSNETPDRAAALAAVSKIATLYASHVA